MIKNLADLKGRRISAVRRSLEYISLTFEDSSYVLFVADIYADSVSIDVDKHPTPYILKELGIISKEEYDHIVEQADIERNARTEKMERETLARLERKYKR